MTHNTSYPDGHVTVWLTWIICGGWRNTCASVKPCSPWPGHSADLGILAINLPLILSPMVWEACVSGPMKVTPSAACRDNKGFTFTAQAYQVEAGHIRSIVNKYVCEWERVGGQIKRGKKLHMKYIWSFTHHFWAKLYLLDVDIFVDQKEIWALVSQKYSGTVRS